MPLPKALAAKLAKRGIIKISLQPKEPEPEVTNTLQEEIIAEDYDDTPLPESTPAPPPPDKFNKFQGWYSCPNKWNVYHECTSACQEQWKDIKEIDKEYNRKRIKMLIKHPIPSHWQEILDIGLRRYYYWNTETDLVSWLPPGHPKCRVSVSAAHLRKQMLEEREKRLKEEKNGKKESDEEEEESSDDEGGGGKRKRKLSPSKEEANSAESSSESVEEGKPSKEKRMREKRERNRDRGRERDKERRGKERSRVRRGAKRKEDSDALDPMDPAAYSECPRGTWASGLPERNEARTGVDSTATGPLFQMRPYPNPGAVLRANAAVNSVGPKKPT